MAQFIVVLLFTCVIALAALSVPFDTRNGECPGDDLYTQYADEADCKGFVSLCGFKQMPFFENFSHFSFFICLYGKKVAAKCPSEMLYNVAKMKCDKAERVACSEGQGQSTKPPSGIQSTESTRITETVKELESTATTLTEIYSTTGEDVRTTTESTGFKTTTEGLESTRITATAPELESTSSTLVEINSTITDSTASPTQESTTKMVVETTQPPQTETTKREEDLTTNAETETTKLSIETTTGTEGTFTTGATDSSGSTTTEKANKTTSIGLDTTTNLDEATTAIPAVSKRQLIPTVNPGGSWTSFPEISKASHPILSSILLVSITLFIRLW